MSARFLEEALDYFEHNPSADAAQEARRRARAEVAAIRKAAKAMSALRPIDKETGLALGLMDNIAKEAE